jgi:hypothetical protein
MGQCRQKLNVFTLKIIDIEIKMAGGFAGRPAGQQSRGLLPSRPSINQSLNDNAS